MAASILNTREGNRSSTSRTEWDALDQALLKSYFEQAVKHDDLYRPLLEAHDQKLIQEHLVMSGLAEALGDGTVCLTEEGTLFCCRRELIPRKTFHVHTKFQRKIETEDLNEELFGSVLYLYYELYDRLSPLFQRRIGSPDIRDKSGSESVYYEYPPVAIVEALVNFLIHRDYSRDDRGYITVYPDRIEFVNPGTSSYSPEILLSSESALRPLYPRNPRLIEAMNKARLNQAEGSGILRIRRSLSQNKSNLPSGKVGLEIENDNEMNRFSLVIYKRAFSDQPFFDLTPSLHQLPSPPTDFTGRTAELAELCAKFEQGVTTSGLQGQGGVGKTALALALAAQLMGRYPDAQIFLDLKGGSTSPLPAGAIMAHVVRSFQPMAKLPDSEVELKAAYHSTLFKKRALLLLDNARDAEQIKPLMPPPAGCGVIVTSRLHFHLPGLYAQNLEALPMKDARDLLLKIAPRIGEEAEHIAQLCGYLPLTLTMAGSVLAERIDLSPATYAHRLGDEQTRLDMVMASYTLSYELLSEELRATWRMLAAFPNTFEVEGAAAVCDVERDVAEMQLSELVRYSLVNWDALKERYDLHDLARLFANSKLNEPDRTAARLRHSVHYKDLLSVADALYLKGGDDLSRGLALFDLEWINIQTGQAWAAEFALMIDGAARLCNAYTGAGIYCLNLRLHPREWINWLEESLASARHLNDQRSEGSYVGNLGAAYAALGETRRAIEFYEQALEIARATGDQRGEGAHLGNLGAAYATLGEMRRAIEFYEQALLIAREIGDRRGEGNHVGNLGNAYAILGETRRAIEFYEQALEIARAIGDRRGEGNRLGNLGNAYAVLGKTRRAIEFYEQALTISRAIGDRRGEGTDLGNLGTSYAALGETRRAIEFYEQALLIAREIGDRSGEGNRLGNLGNAYAALGEYEKAVPLAENALKILEAIESPYVEIVQKNLNQWRNPAP